MLPQVRPYAYQGVYAGAPIQAQANAYQMGANAYERNLDKYDAVQQFRAGLHTLPGDADAVAHEFEQASAAVKQLASTDINQRRFDLAGRQVDSMASQLMASPVIRAATESYFNYDAGEKKKMEMRDKGLTPIEFSSPANHSSVTKDGKISIYRPHIEPKANYIQDAASLWNTLAPEIIKAGLTKTDVDGILQGQIIKGITPEMVRSRLELVKQTYGQSDSGRQQRRLYEQEGDKHPDQSIDNFLLGIGLMKVHEDADIKYQTDPQYALQSQMAMMNYQQSLQERTIEKRASETLKNQMTMLTAKKKTGRPDMDSSADTFFSPRRITNEKGATQLEAGHIIGINAPPIINGLSQTYGHLDPDMYKFVGISGKGLSPKDTEIIGDPKILGIVTSNVHGENYRGGFYGTVSYKDGKDTKTANVIMVNPNEQLRNVTTTVSDIEDYVSKAKLGKESQGYFIPDRSGLLSTAYESMRQASGNANLTLEAGFVIKPRGDGKNAQVEPAFRRSPSDTKPITLSNAEAQNLSLHTSYDIDGIYRMTQDKLAALTKPYVQTNKSAQEALP